MQSKNHKLAQLSAMLAQHMVRTSAYTCASLAMQLTSIGASLEQVQTWECNGYKNKQMDDHLNKLSRTDVEAAKAYCDKINRDGAAYVSKRMAQLEKKLAAIRTETGCSFTSAGLSGVCWTLPNGSEYFI